MHVIQRPYISLDLNTMKNAWNLLIRAVYSNGKQNAKIEELNTAVIAHREGIDQDTLRCLARYMDDRTFTLKCRAFTSY